MLFLRGLRWRRGFSAAVLLVGLISAAVAAIGPLYARASSESTLTDELRAGGARAGLSFSSVWGVNDRQRPGPGWAAASGRRRPSPGTAPPFAASRLVVTAKNAAGAVHDAEHDGLARGPVRAHHRHRRPLPHRGRPGHRPGRHDALRPRVGGSGDELTLHQGIEAPGRRSSTARSSGTVAHRRRLPAPRLRRAVLVRPRLLPVRCSARAVTSVVRAGADAVFVQPAQFDARARPVRRRPPCCRRPRRSTSTCRSSRDARPPRRRRRAARASGRSAAPLPAPDSARRTYPAMRTGPQPGAGRRRAGQAAGRDRHARRRPRARRVQPAGAVPGRRRRGRGPRRRDRAGQAARAATAAHGRVRAGRARDALAGRGAAGLPARAGDDARRSRPLGAGRRHAGRPDDGHRLGSGARPSPAARSRPRWPRRAPSPVPSSSSGATPRRPGTARSGCWPSTSRSPSSPWPR